LIVYIGYLRGPVVWGLKVSGITINAPEMQAESKIADEFANICKSICHKHSFRVFILPDVLT
jgi:hypothetical protein